MATIGFFALATAALAVAEAKAEFEVVDADGIYYGKGDHPSAPATIEADTVWLEIPEYQKILEDDLTDDDPKYHILLKKATARFEKALAKVAKRDAHDMIGERGSIEATGEKKKKIPDATSDMVEIVSRD